MYKIGLKWPVIAREGSCLWLLSLTTPATRCPPASRSCLTSFTSSPPMGMGPTTPSTTGRGIRAPMGVHPGSLSRRASLLCWASVAHPMSHFPEGSGLMERTAPTALHSSWLRCHGPSLSNLADPPPMSWITVKISLEATELPSEVWLGATPFTVQAFAAPMRRCTKCQTLGHSKQQCRAKQTRCSKCGKGSHSHEQCDAQVFSCVNCNGCPEKQIRQWAAPKCRFVKGRIC